MDWRPGGVLLRRACAHPELEMRFYDVFAYIQGFGGQENLPARPNPEEIWAWGGGTRGKGSAVSEAWMRGGLEVSLEVCFYYVFEHIQGLICVLQRFYAHPGRERSRLTKYAVEI